MRCFAIFGLVLGCFLVIGDRQLPAQTFYFGSGGFGIGPSGYGHHDHHYMPYDFGHHGYGPYGHHGDPHYGNHYDHSHWGLILNSDAPYQQQTIIRQRAVVEPTEADYSDARPPLPTDEELARMSWRELRGVLRYSIRHFDDDLSRLSTGGGWKKHLRLGTLSDIIAEDEDAPPDEESREKLAEILGRYDLADADEKYNAITRMWGFRTIHATLAEYHRPMRQRQRVRLAHASRDLHLALSRWSSGHTWQKYLALPEEILADTVFDPASADTGPDIEQLQKALAHFDNTSNNEKYHEVAELPEFQAAHEMLSEYLGHYVEPPTEVGPSAKVDGSEPRQVDTY